MPEYPFNTFTNFNSSEHRDKDSKARLNEAEVKGRSYLLSKQTKVSNRKSVNEGKRNRLEAGRGR